MSGAVFPYDVQPLAAPRFGLIALQSDETIEADMRRLLPPEVELLVSRVRSGSEVTSGSLAGMKQHLTAAAALFPEGARFDAVGYGCTSGTAEIGADTVAGLINAATETPVVTQPLSSLVAACARLDLHRIAFLSPYIAEVSDKLRQALGAVGIETPVFGSFEIATEATVVRIDAASIEAAALSLMQDSEADALFISCTNLRALDVIAPLEDRLGKPVLSSNQVLAWHMLTAAGVDAPGSAPGVLFRG